MIRGVGLDLVEIDRIEGVMQRHGRRFLERVYTPHERHYCRRYQGRAYMARLAARFAAKEAVAKALGTGIRGFSWRQIEITRGELGAPAVILHDGARDAARQAGIRTVMVALTHGRQVAAAQALAVDQPPDTGVVS